MEADIEKDAEKFFSSIEPADPCHLVTVKELFFKPLSEQLESCGFSLSGIIDLMQTRDVKRLQTHGNDQRLDKLEFLIKFNPRIDLQNNIDNLEQTLITKGYIDIQTHIFAQVNQIIVLSARYKNKRTFPSTFVLTRGPIYSFTRDVNVMCVDYSCSEYSFFQLYDRFMHFTKSTTTTYVSRIATSIVSCTGVKECYMIKDLPRKELLEIATNKTNKWSRERKRFQETNRLINQAMEEFGCDPE